LIIQAVSIRRRVVDAAESRPVMRLWGSAAGFNPPPRRGRGGITPGDASLGVCCWFQSAAASWTRRNWASPQDAKNVVCFHPPPRRGRGGMWPCVTENDSTDVFQSAAASWTRRNRVTFHGPLPVTVFQSAAASWTRRNYKLWPTHWQYTFVSIRRRVVDAAECGFDQPIE